jgi:RNA polymerase sigma factor (sigma-70 family)
VIIDSNHALRRDLQAIFNAGTLAGLSDGQLLQRFTTRRDDRERDAEAEAVFALLIERHGPMVLRVCRGILGDRHEAEDALQATFLVLLRQAGSIRKCESVGPWLHGVARRVASCARSAAARRRAHERRWGERRREEGHDAGSASGEIDLSATIHAELDRLPERYRAPIVLCDLEERPLDEAARQLGWPLGTIKSRLNRGRQRLRDRLVRRGVAPQVAGLALGGSVLSGPAEAASAVSTALVDATARMLAGAGKPSATVLALVERVGRMMLMTRLKFDAVFAVAIGLSAVGIGAVAGGPRRGTDTATFQGIAAAPAPQKTHAADKGRAAPARRRTRPGTDSRRESITVSGRAIDSSGRPVAGAAVYVIDTNRCRFGGGRDLLAMATTGPDGSYLARDVELPVWKPEPGPLPAPEEGRFQVAATAPGFGFTWHPVTGFRPDRRPPSDGRKAGAASREPEAFYRREPIAIDLSFEPPASVHGKVVDDRGRPLAGARVQVGVCNSGRRGATMSLCSRVDPKDPAPDERRDFSGIPALPESLLSTRTGPDGSYRIDGLPREAQFLARIDPGPDYEPFEATIATTAAPIANVRSLGHDGVLDWRSLAARQAWITVRYADTKQPARDVTIRARSDLTWVGAGGVGVTDDEGRTTLRLKPCAYEITVEPPFGAPYLPGQFQIPVTDGDWTKYSPFELDPAAIVTMEARDAKTGAGIGGVRFQYETDSDSRRRELRSQLVVVDHPETDEQGRLQAIVEPGRKRFFVGTVPSGWKYEGARGTPVILVAGRELTIRWSFNRVEEPKSDAASGPALFPDDLVEKWRHQDRRALPGKFRIRRYSYSVGDDPVPSGEFEAFLDANDLSQVPDPAAALEARFPQMPESQPGYYEIIDDGRRRRNVFGFSAETRRDNVLVSNGEEVVRYDGSNGQSDIGYPFMVFGLRDICDRPWMVARGRPQGRPMGEVRQQESGGRLMIELARESVTQRWVVDRRTGFVHADSMRSTRKGLVGHIVRQYGPKTYRDGVVLPTVFVRASFVDVKMLLIELTLIDEVDLDYRPTPLDFTVAAPTETVIMDYREDRSHPKQGLNRYPVADVLIRPPPTAPRPRRDSRPSSGAGP